jgi:hypothetical protein
MNAWSEALGCLGYICTIWHLLRAKRNSRESLWEKVVLQDINTSSVKNINHQGLSVIKLIQLLDMTLPHIKY